MRPVVRQSEVAVLTDDDDDDGTDDGDGNGKCHRLMRCIVDVLCGVKLSRLT